MNSAVLPRVFKNIPEIYYTGTVHEKIVHKHSQLLAANAIEYIQVMHTGYSKEDVKSKNKSERNLKLLFDELEKDPHSGNLCFYISEAYAAAGDSENALKYAYKVLETKSY